MLDRSGRDAEERVRVAIATWRDSLIDLTGRNRLLNFKVTRTSAVEIVRPSAGEVFAGLAAGRTFRLRSLKTFDQDGHPAQDVSPTVEPMADQLAIAAHEIPAPDSGVLDTQKEPTDLALALRTLMRRSTQEYLDRGLWVLYLAFGTLTWIEGDSRLTSPLLLAPVRVESSAARQMPTLTAAEEDLQVNPALAMKLQEYDVELPTVADLEETTLAAFLDEVEAVVAAQPGWMVTSSVHLSCFSFAKEAMYQDLKSNEGQAAAHPAIRALALGGTGETIGDLLFDECPDDRIDTDAPPEATPTVLDADTSQRAAIAAAIAGRSFVMDGPPGTGKSQTIANIIGALLHAGKSVLFVSEKAAALDVVRDRLTEVGLEAYLFELHSHKATRKEVAATLGRALDTVPVPPSSMSHMDVGRARQRRQQLNAYAEAMNNALNPLGMSMHQVLGAISKLREVPNPPATGIASADLTVDTYGEVLAAANTLARAWRPAREGNTFIWRGARTRGSLDSRLYQALNALQRLEAITSQHQELVEAFELRRPSQAGVLAVLLGLRAQRPAYVPARWLTERSLEEITATVKRLDWELETLRERNVLVEREAGPNWQTLPERPPPDVSVLAQLNPPGLPVDDFFPEQAAALALQFRGQAEMLATRAGSLSGLASMLGLPAPSTFSDAGDLLAIASIAQVEHRPEHPWLSSGGLARATEAVQVLADAIAECVEAEQAARQFYTGTALSEPDLPALAARFENHHHGLKRLGGAYRADKRAVAAFTADGVSRNDAHAQLRLAVAWKARTDALVHVEAKHASALGTYYCGRNTDFELAAEAIEHARTAVNLGRGVDLSKAAEQIARPATPNPTLLSITNDTRTDIDGFLGTLAPAPLPAARPELEAGSLANAIAWLHANADILRAVAEHTSAVSTAAATPLTVGRALRLSTLRSRVAVARANIADHSAEYINACASLYAADRTDMDAVKAAAAWATQVRSVLTGADEPLSPVQAKAYDASLPTTSVTAAATAWEKTRSNLLDAFDAPRRIELGDELDDYADAADLLQALRDDTSGQEEWFSHQSSRDTLREHGLDSVVDFCIHERVRGESVPKVVERSLLQEWADHQLATDPAFSSVRAEDRDALVAEYRELDKALVGAATAEIIRACNERRPRADVGAAAVIRHEAAKKRKHMPVRVLIERTSAISQAIKPCFMMSPLAVSQYLPPSIRFDAVIFDEASQLSPGDAINCIYRGNAVITAGDEKQLPPTNFFSSATAANGDDEWTEDAGSATDFESILDAAKASGEFKSLTLRWHYRSRHEALIAFSNTSFYGGHLVTFPSVQSAGPHVGVELFPVDGVYRRGSSRDNPVEAAKVAERVLHHFDTRASLTLGVVAFSEAQAAAIETAIDSARINRPDLDRFFIDDRLHGFFVKNLESVQGDERDVMIFSIGYGRDENGKLTIQFGPLTKPGGQRRLNVAITRARYRNEIVSSISAADVTADENESLRHLRRYLDYAARGIPALALDVTGRGGDAESPFEESVIAAIRTWGYNVTPQVGASGYRIDIGVQHPDHPGVYILGVECDGFQYHSSKAARDRDRLRAQVLRGLGWRLHRIWGTAWYRNRHGEEESLRVAIESAVHAPVIGLLTGPDSAYIDRPTIKTAEAKFDEHPTWAVPYRPAQIPPLPSWTEPGDAGSWYDMAKGIRTIADEEGPVHISVVDQRLRDAWGIGRIGVRIRENIDAAIRHAEVLRDRDFITLPGRVVDRVRTPTAECVRSVEQVHDDELTLALVNFVRDARGISEEDLTTHVARLYGWTRRGPDIANRMSGLVSTLRERGQLVGGSDLLTSIEPR